jgi:mannose-6-phosphate isomerase-like protein (cupin superfamily)
METWPIIEGPGRSSRAACWIRTGARRSRYREKQDDQERSDRTVAKGDVIVVPPGTPHWFNAIDGTITYLESRVRTK